MSQKVVLIDYGSGNLRSAQKALEKAALAEGLNRQVVVSDDPASLGDADRVVLPGVGAFGDCYRGLATIPGMLEALQAYHETGRPFLGICVGMQLLAREGFEHGTHQGLGWIDAVVGPLKPKDASMKIPHMGWNALELSDAGRTHPLTKDIAPGEHAYFVHGYHMAALPHGLCLAHCDYGGPVVAVVAKGTAAGTQFHPEKSQSLGLKFLTGFLRWTP